MHLRINKSNGRQYLSIGHSYREKDTGNQEHYQRGFAPEGQPPIIRVESQRKRVNMMSATTNHLWFWD